MRAGVRATFARGAGAALLAAALLALAPSARAADAIKIGVLKLASSGPVFIAAEEGYFAAEGVAPSLVYFDAAQPVAVAAVSGGIDVGVTGLTAGFYNLAGKGELRIIGAQSREEPGYHLIAYLVSDRAFDGGLTSLKDLPGHSVAVTQIGSTFHYSLGLLAEKLGFPLDRVRIVPLQSMSGEASALAGNQVDAGLLPATVADPLVEKGSAHLLGWVGDETPWQLGAVFAARQTIAARRPAIAAFLKAYRHGVRDFYDAFLTKGPDGHVKLGPNAPAMLAILAKYTGQRPDQLKDAIPYVDPQGRLLVRDIYHQVAWYQSQGLVAKGVDVSSILDYSLIIYNK
jgi:NitT/TauT family transport system substrate-binding protein